MRLRVGARNDEGSAPAMTPLVMPDSIRHPPKVGARNDTYSEAKNFQWKSNR